jgi:hypothetical protein
MSAIMERGASISECGRYRYELSRRWGDGPTTAFVMLNPSTADAEQDDPTIRRCIGFARRDGAGALAVVNLYAFRATTPKELLRLSSAERIGRGNVEALRHVISGTEVERVVCAWGAFPLQHMLKRVHVEKIAHEAGRPSVCLGTTKAGAPRHPLYVQSDTPYQAFGSFVD